MKHNFESKYSHKTIFCLSGIHCGIHSSSLLEFIIFISYSQMLMSALKECSTALVQRNVKILPEATDVCVQRG